MVEKLYHYTLTDEKTAEIFLSDDNCTVGHVILQPGDELEEHSTDSNVYLLIIRGAITLSLNKAETKTFGTGVVVNLPFGTVMGMKNSSENVMELFAFKSPAPKNYASNIF
jgi:quercetin dioxygenase-like cupin family protein